MVIKAHLYEHEMFLFAFKMIHGGDLLFKPPEVHFNQLHLVRFGFSTEQIRQLCEYFLALITYAGGARYWP